MPDDPVDLSRLAQDFGDDHEFLREIYTVYLEDCKERVEQLKKSITDNDPQKCSHFAHALKGASANVGANRVRDVAFELELAAYASDLSQAEAMFDRLQLEFQQAGEFLKNFIQNLDK